MEFGVTLTALRALMRRNEKMKLYCFYFTQPHGDALECRMYFGGEDEIQEVARKLAATDNTYVYFEEFNIAS